MTPPDSLPDVSAGGGGAAGVKDGSGSARYGGGSGDHGAGDEAAGEPKEDDNIPVALPAAGVGLGVGSNGLEAAAPNSGSRGQSLMGGGGAAAAGGVYAWIGGGGAGAGGGVEGVVLKNWVKLPSAEAESEIPGVENPFIFDGFDGLVAAGWKAGVSAVFLCSLGAAEEATKMRVNSPGAGGGAEGA